MLELLEEVSTGPGQVVDSQWPRAFEHVKCTEELLGWAPESPLPVGWVLVVRRDSDGHVAGLSRFEEAREIRDCVVLGDASAEDRPSGTVGAQEVVLGVDHDQRRPRPVEHEFRVREGLLGLLGGQRLVTDTHHPLFSSLGVPVVPVCLPTYARPGCGPCEPGDGTPGPQPADRGPARPVPGYPAPTVTVHGVPTKVEPYRTGREGLESHPVRASSASRTSSRTAGRGGDALANQGRSARPGTLR